MPGGGPSNGRAEAGTVSVTESDQIPKPLLSRTMGEAYLPAGWPETVAPPGSQDWEASAVAFPVKFICSDQRSVNELAGGRLPGRRRCPAARATGGRRG